MREMRIDKMHRFLKKLNIYFRKKLNLGKVRKNISGFIMNLDLNDNGISKSLYFEGGREHAYMFIIKKTVSKSMICLDIGANIGYTTLYMLRNAGKTGFVYAIEPDPHNFKILMRNVRENNFSSNCKMSRCILSDKNGEADFWIADKPNLNSVHRTRHSIRKIKIPSYNLSTYLKNKKFPQFIKMDVEGHEVNIFRGGLDYFGQNKSPTNLLVEVHPKYYNEANDFAAILSEYFKLGFYPKYVVSTPVAIPRLFSEAGYFPVKSFKTDGFIRGLYKNIKNEDLLRFACYENKENTSNKIVRSFLLVRK